MLRKLLSILALVSVTACSPTLRFQPGEVPPAETPPKELKVQAENYVAAYVNQSNYDEIKGGAQNKRVKNVVERLSRAAGYPSNTFPVHVINAGDDVNAAAVNGASIMVYTELLNRVKSDDELAVILGHEIGHILAKHYKDKEEEESRGSAVSTASSILGSVASIATSAAGYGGAANLAGDLTETTSGLVGYGVFVGAFSRTQEYEADNIGLMIMARAKYNPQTAVELWGRAEEIFGTSDSSAGAFFSTHPASGQRMRALEESMPLAMAEYQSAGGGAKSSKK